MALIFLLFLISVGLGYFFFFIYLKKTKKAQEVRLAHLPPMTIFKTFLVQNKSSARICTINFPPSQFALSNNLTDREISLMKSGGSPAALPRSVRNSAARCTSRQNRILILASILKILASISKILASILKILASIFFFVFFV